MWLKLNLGGIDFHFRIKGYKKSTDNWDEEWSSIDLTLQSREWLNYQIRNDDLLLMREVEIIKGWIEALLSDEISEKEYMECIEPDLCFIFYPKYNLKDDPRYTYVRPGYEIVDIYMELKVAFWDDGLTDNRFILVFGRKDLEMFLCYLNLITGEADKNDEDVKKLVAQGIIYGQGFNKI